MDFNLSWGGSKASTATPADWAGEVVPPKVQAGRDQERISILQAEAQRYPDAAPALQKVIADTQAGMPKFNQPYSQQAQPQAQPAPSGGGMNFSLDWGISGQNKTAPIEDNKPSPSNPSFDGKTKVSMGEDPVTGALEAGANVITGLGSTLAAGAGGLGALVTGASTDEAANVVRGIQDQYTYQPRGSAGKAIADTVGKVSPGGVIGGWNAIADLARGNGLNAAVQSAERGTDNVTDPIGAVSPALGAIAKGAVDVSPMLAGIRGGAKAAPRAAGDPAPLPAVAPTVTDAMGSVGAQGRSPTAILQEQIANASPEISAALQNIDPKRLNQTAVDRHLEMDTLPIPPKLMEGQATGNPQLHANEFNAKGKVPEVGARFAEQNQNLIDNLQAIKDQAAPDAYGRNTVEHGQDVVNSYKSMDAAKVADISAKYKALEEANGGQFPIDGNAFLTNADAALAKAMKGRYVPSEIIGDMGDIRSNGGVMTFEQFENMRTNLAAEGRKAARSGDGNREYAVNLVRTALEDMPITGDAAALKPLADAARKAARERFDAIKADPAYKAVVNDAASINEASPLADNFITTYVTKGKLANVQKMLENIGNDPVARQTMAKGVIEDLRKSAGITENNTGNFTQAGYNKALQAVNPKLLDIVGPKAAQQLNTLGNAARYQMEQLKGGVYNNSGTAILGSNPIVEGAKNAAKTGIAATLAAATHGASIPILGAVGKIKQAMGEKAALKRTLEPGAGATYQTKQTGSSSLKDMTK